MLMGEGVAAPVGVGWGLADNASWDGGRAGNRNQSRGVPMEAHMCVLAPVLVAALVGTRGVVVGCRVDCDSGSQKVQRESDISEKLCICTPLISIDRLTVPISY